MPHRTISSNEYRYGFNGKENDSNGEWGDQLIQDYGFRLYNPAIGKFLSVDPLAPSYPWNSTYAFAEGNPVRFIDLDGLEKLDPMPFMGGSFPELENGNKISSILGTEYETHTLYLFPGKSHRLDLSMEYDIESAKDAFVTVINTNKVGGLPTGLSMLSLPAFKDLDVIIIGGHGDQKSMQSSEGGIPFINHGNNYVSHDEFISYFRAAKDGLEGKTIVIPNCIFGLDPNNVAELAKASGATIYSSINHTSTTKGGLFNTHSNDEPFRGSTLGNGMYPLSINVFALDALSNSHSYLIESMTHEEKMYYFNMVGYMLKGNPNGDLEVIPAIYIDSNGDVHFPEVTIYNNEWSMEVKKDAKQKAKNLKNE